MEEKTEALKVQTFEQIYIQPSAKSRADCTPRGFSTVTVSLLVNNLIQAKT